MITPGSDLLDMALDLIESQTVQYLRASGRTLNAKGMYESEYAAPVTIDRGSVQAMPRNVVKRLGLDEQANYVTWYVSADVVDLQRKESGDMIIWQGRKWKLSSETDWFAMDGWTSVVAVDVGAAS